MLGVILAFGSAIAFAFNGIVTRRGVLRASSNYIANISILTGPVFSILVALVSADILKIGHYPWKAGVLMALSGIVHFALGRTFAYRSVQLIGATRSNIVTSLSPIVSVTLAIVVVGERLNALMALGILFSLSSPFLTLWKEETVAGGSQILGGIPGKDVDSHTLRLGMFFGAGAALFWGSSFVFIKLGLESGGTPIIGNLLAYSGATIAILPSVLKRENKKEMRHAGWDSLKMGLLVGLTTNIAQLFRYLALEYGSVIVVTAVIRTTPLGVLLLSFIFNRQFESFSRWVLLSNALLVVGTFLVIIA